jgi:hypothetical protein
MYVLLLVKNTGQARTVRPQENSLNEKNKNTAHRIISRCLGKVLDTLKYGLEMK